MSLMLLAQVAAAAPPSSLTVEVTDADGNPVPTAIVRELNEGQRHRVHTETGRWTSSMLYLPDGTELIFQRGVRLDLEVLAPGWHARRISVEFNKRRQHVDIALSPMSLDPDPAAMDVETTVYEVLHSWVDAEAAYVITPGEETFTRAESLRRQLAEPTELWLSWLDAEGHDRARAEEVCRIAHDHPERCEG